MSGGNPAGSPRRVHLIEPGPLGHGPLWLDYLLDALLPCVEQVTVTHPDFPAYRGLVERAARLDGRLQLRPVAWRGDKRSWPETLRRPGGPPPDLVLLTWLDVILKKFRGDLRRRLGGAPVWGIWYLPAPRGPLRAWDWRRLISGQARGRYREQRVLRQAPAWLSGAFVLDDGLLERITPRPGLALRVLPDPWPEMPAVSRAEARRRLELPEESRIFLHFGVANPRKGLGDAIMAWAGLADEPAAVLLRAGLTGDDDAAALAPLIAAGRAVLRDRRIPDADVNLYFLAADWILLPYRRHEGSSGLLAAAAAARRPVIAADYGVIGQRLRRQRLGLLYPHGDLAGLEAAIRQALRADPGDFSAALADYAAAHDLARFAQALRDALGLRAAPVGQAAAPAELSRYHR